MTFETGIPIPKATRRAKWAEMLKVMEVGQSKVFDDLDVANTFRYCGYHQGYKMRMRKMSDGFRVWRVE